MNDKKLKEYEKIVIIPEHVYRTVRVYGNGRVELNNVAAVDLIEHIEYNRDWRPGCALFVEGELVTDGCMLNPIEYWNKKKANLEAKGFKFEENFLPVIKPYR